MLVTNSLTDSLTDCRLVNLIDVTLACEDTNSKHFDVVTAADVDYENPVGNSLLQISKLRFGQNAKLLFRLWAQGLAKILKLKLRQDFEAEVYSVFCCWCLVEVKILTLGLVMILSLSLVQMLMFGWDFEVDAWSIIDILKMKFDQELCLNLWYDLNKLLW